MRVLLIEDEPTLREQLVVQLHAEGFAVDSTGSGTEGVNRPGFIGDSLVPIMLH